MISPLPSGEVKSAANLIAGIALLGPGIASDVIALKSAL
jgi:UPF0716 family protein affecting phage T7 exclusion